MFSHGNVTQLFLSFSRLKYAYLGQIKDTNKVWEVRKRRVKYVPLKNKIKMGIGIILLLLFFIVPYLPGMKHFISIPNELITYQSDDPLPILPIEHDMTQSTDSKNVITDK